MTLKHLYLITALAIAGCAPAGSTAGGVPAPRSSSTTLSAEEMAARNLDRGTLYDAISRLRSNWLKHSARTYETQSATSETSAVVFVEGQRYGDVESLKNIDASQIADVRYYSPAESAKFGIQAGFSGVIEVSIKKR